MRPLLLAALSCALLASCNRPTSVTRDHIRFAHAPHLSAGLSCTSCHVNPLSLIHISEPTRPY